MKDPLFSLDQGLISLNFNDQKNSIWPNGEE